MASNDLGDWYRGIPQMTRYWFTGSVVLPLLGRFGVFSPMTMILDYYAVFHHFHIWRPVTALFYFPLSPATGFQYLILLYFLYSYSTRLETGLFDGKPADYLFLLVFNWLCLVLIGFIIGLPAMYLPWVLLAFNMIIRGGGVQDIIGIIVGHLYFFLMFKYPQDFGGRRFLSTPEIFYKWFPNRRGGVAGFGMAPESRRRDDGGAGGGRPWGRGQQLGGN